MEITEARFLVSNTTYLQCPKPEIPEYAFIGRSNVGKSSLINMLTGRKNLAKTSNTPGKTRLINHFIINNDWYLVDLPGYGFAKISKTTRLTWEKMLHDYLLHRTNLNTTFILIDSRLEPQKPDIEFITWFGEKDLPFALLFTKADKLTKSQLKRNLETYKKVLLQQWDEAPISIVTSAKTGLGKDQLLMFIGEMNTGMSMDFHS
jgi:GTP-binding protein